MRPNHFPAVDVRATQHSEIGAISSFRGAPAARTQAGAGPAGRTPGGGGPGRGRGLRDRRSAFRSRRGDGLRAAGAGVSASPVRSARAERNTGSRSRRRSRPRRTPAPHGLTLPPARTVFLFGDRGGHRLGRRRRILVEAIEEFIDGLVGVEADLDRVGADEGRLKIRRSLEMSFFSSASRAARHLGARRDLRSEMTRVARMAQLPPKYPFLPPIRQTSEEVSNT